MPRSIKEIDDELFALNSELFGDVPPDANRLAEIKSLKAELLAEKDAIGQQITGTAADTVSGFFRKKGTGSFQRFKK